MEGSSGTGGKVEEAGVASFLRRVLCDALHRKFVFEIAFFHGIIYTMV
jgi:hypothetical protein